MRNLLSSLHYYSKISDFKGLEKSSDILITDKSLDGKPNGLSFGDHVSLILWVTYVVMFAGLCVAAGIAVVLIRMTINGSKKKKARMSIMMKIFTSYLQCLSLLPSSWTGLKK